MRLVIEVTKPGTLLALLAGGIGFVVWTISNVQSPPMQAELIADVGGNEVPVQEEILSAEDNVRRRRQEIQLMERKEEILRYQLSQLEEAQQRLGGEGNEEISAQLEQSRAYLLALLKDKRAAENQLRSSLQQVWEAEERGGRVSLSLSGPVTALVWPVEPTIGLSAGFHDAGYEQHFGIPHEAIDIPVLQGTVVRAPADGTVDSVADNDMGYSYLILKHQGVATLYGHVSSFLVQEGESVRAGDPIALSGGQPGTRGAGALTTGPHLHFETIINGEHVDPLTILPDDPNVQ
jgi:murein DD-endopeptidase MepM/ murein hydrolase activator NlpD